ncbi:MAG TPA: hypothetical protein VNA14_08710 [Mycobacteriales bacterium]|nr:hypothetical protein [Mycobacteriales bacterium]
MIAVAVVAFALAGALAPAAAAARPETATRTATRVVVLGVPGLDWRDVTPTAMPRLHALAAEGSIGALSVRAATAVTRRYDGWVTLGAGNRARARTVDKDESATLPPEGQEQLPAPRPVPPGAPIRDPAIGPIQRNNDRLSFDTRIGALGEALVEAGLRSAAVGRGAMLGALDQDGDVSAYAETLDALPDPARFDLVVVEDASAYRDDSALGAVDATVGALVDERRPGDLLLVLGVSHRRLDVPHLQVAIARGPGFEGGRLRSASTRRDGFAQLIDVAPTVLYALGVEVPDGVVGQRLLRVGGRRTDEIARLVDHDVAAVAHRRYVPPFFFLLVLAQLLLYGYAWWALRRRPASGRDRLRRFTRQASLAFAAVPAATYLAQIVPWWRHGLAVLLVVVAAFVGVVFAVASAGPWRRRILGPPGAVAAMTAVVLAADLVTGARLQLSSLAGYSPLVAGRFAGIGNVAFAVLATSALLATAALCDGRRRTTTVGIVAAVGVVTIAVDGNPSWGSDFGGVVALVPGFVVLGLLLTGRRVSWRIVCVVALLAVALVTAFALLDYTRPEESRSHLGRFVEQVRDGGAGTIVKRKAQANVRLLTHSVLTLVVPIAVGFLAFVLLKPWGGLRRALERTPALRAGLIAVLVMALVGFAANDSGVAVPALALTLAIPIALSVSVRTAEIEAEEVPTDGAPG